MSSKHITKIQVVKKINPKKYLCLIQYNTGKIIKVISNLSNIKKINKFVEKYLLNISDDELYNFFITCFKMDLVPVLVGHTGTGKTERIYQFSEKYGYEMFSTHLGQMADVSEFAGISIPETKQNEKYLELYLTNLFNKISNSQKPLLFLDEYNRAPRDVLSAVFQLFAEKKLRGISFPHLSIIGAINPFGLTGYSGLIKDDEAWKSRVVYLQYLPDIDQWISYFQQQINKALQEKQSNPNVIVPNKIVLDYFIEDLNSRVFFAPEPKEDINEYVGYPNPKRWFKLSKLSTDELNNNELLARVVGLEAGSSFYKFIENKLKAVKITGDDITLENLKNNTLELMNKYIGNTDTHTEYFK